MESLSATLQQCDGNRTSSSLKVHSSHYNERTQSFQMYPPQRSFLKSIVFSVGIPSFNVDGRAKQINIYTFVDLPGLMWTGP